MIRAPKVNLRVHNSLIESSLNVFQRITRRVFHSYTHLQCLSLSTSDCLMKCHSAEKYSVFLVHVYLLYLDWSPIEIDESDFFFSLPFYSSVEIAMANNLQTLQFFAATITNGCTQLFRIMIINRYTKAY